MDQNVAGWKWEKSRWKQSSLRAEAQSPIATFSTLAFASILSLGMNKQIYFPRRSSRPGCDRSTYAWNFLHDKNRGNTFQNIREGQWSPWKERRIEKKRNTWKFICVWDACRVSFSLCENATFPYLFRVLSKRCDARQNSRLITDTQPVGVAISCLFSWERNLIFTTSIKSCPPNFSDLVRSTPSGYEEKKYTWCSKVQIHFRSSIRCAWPWPLGLIKHLR